MCGCADESIPAPRYAFYHWEQRLELDSTEQKRLAHYGAEGLYVKAFDVVWKDGRAEPTALLEYRTETALRRVVPLVFITEEVFRNLPPERTERLAADIYRLLLEVIPVKFQEIQIDCDWTVGSRKSFFAFLKALREALPEDGRLSCTLRLHQYRDREAQGIPPADRVVLMAYNTGRLGAWETENSIVDTTIISNYVNGVPPYPLPLDLALAVYDWAAVFREGELTYLINEPPLEKLADTSRFSTLDEFRYAVDSSTYLDGLYLYRGDRIRWEVASIAMAEALENSLWPQVSTTGSERIIFYRLGARAWEF